MRRFHQGLRLRAAGISKPVAGLLPRHGVSVKTNRNG